MAFANLVNTGNKFDDYIKNWMYLLGLSQTNLGIQEILEGDDTDLKDLPAWSVVFEGVRTNWSAIGGERTSQIGASIRTFVQDVETLQEFQELVKLTYRTYKVIAYNYYVNGFTGRSEIEDIRIMTIEENGTWIIVGSEIQVWADLIENIPTNTEPYTHPGTD